MHIVSSLSVGGMEQVVLRLAVAQQAAGHHVAVLALKGGPLRSELLTLRIPVRVLNGGRILRGFRTVRYARINQPDIVHAHNPTSLHYAVVATLVSGAALIVTIHGDQQTHARLGSRIEWRFVSGTAVVSRAAQEGLRLPVDSRKLTIIHNGIAPIRHDVCRRTQMRAQLVADDACLGAIVARIDGRKGHATLLDSLKILRDAHVNVSIIVVGDGARRGELERRATELGLDPQTIRFLGARTDVDALLEAADFFVLPSDTEGLPLSVLEAMAHGLPVVASCVGGIPEVINDKEEGLLVPPGDSFALAAAIRRICEDRSLRAQLGHAALERVSTEFSLSATARRYDELYMRAVTAA